MWAIIRHGFIVALLLGVLAGQAVGASQRGGLPALAERVAALEALSAGFLEGGVISSVEFVEVVEEDFIGGGRDTVNCPDGKIILGGGIGVFSDGFDVGEANTADSFVITQSMPKAPIDDDPGYGWTFGVDTDPPLSTVDIFVRMMCADQSE